MLRSAGNGTAEHMGKVVPPPDPACLNCLGEHLGFWANGAGRPFCVALARPLSAEMIASCFGWRCAAVADEVIE